MNLIVEDRPGTAVHILWDWNGTLLDDTLACVDTLNEMLSERGLKVVTLEYFKDHFAFPARNFYQLVGLDVPDSQWNKLARKYHEIYARQPSIRLNVDALEALEAVKRRGWRQSILSALHQELLERDLAHYGIAGYFDYIIGSDNYDGGSKLERAKKFMAELRDQGKNEKFLLIGDSLHDHEVASALGIACALVSTGGHAHQRLAAVAPTFATLPEAINLCLTQA